jgi:hypothetical protein
VYGDFVAWLRAQDRPAALAFWRRQLAGFESATPLPRDRSTPVTRRRETDRVDVTVPHDVKAALERWTCGECMTMSALLRAAWAILLARMSGTADVVFGATVSGRVWTSTASSRWLAPSSTRYCGGRRRRQTAAIVGAHAESLDASAFVPAAAGIADGEQHSADRPLSTARWCTRRMRCRSTRGRGRWAACAFTTPTRGGDSRDLTLFAEAADTLRHDCRATDVFGA